MRVYSIPGYQTCAVIPPSQAINRGNAIQGYSVDQRGAPRYERKSSYCNAKFNNITDHAEEDTILEPMNGLDLKAAFIAVVDLFSIVWIAISRLTSFVDQIQHQLIVELQLQQRSPSLNQQNTSRRSPKSPKNRAATRLPPLDGWLWLDFSPSDWQLSQHEREHLASSAIYHTLSLSIFQFQFLQLVRSANAECHLDTIFISTQITF